MGVEPQAGLLSAGVLAFVCRCGRLGVLAPCIAHVLALMSFVHVRHWDHWVVHRRERAVSSSDCCESSLSKSAGTSIVAMLARALDALAFG